MNSHSQHGLFLVSAFTVPQQQSQSLANDVIARLERDLVRANPNRARVTYLPASFFESRRDTPIAILRRVLNCLYSFVFSV